MFNPRIDKPKDNKFFIELYPDAENYNYQEILDKLGLLAFRYAYIIHDKDVLIEESTGEVIGNKKAHIHYYLKTPTMMSRKSLAEHIGLPPNYIQYSLSERMSIRYLIHADNPEKAQYDISLIQSDFDLEKYLLSNDEVESMHIRMLMEFIEQHPHCHLSELMKFAVDNDCYKDLRKSSYLFAQLLKS